MVLFSPFKLRQHHLCMQAATFADIDSDGMLEILVASANGAVYVLEGRTGRDSPNFPFYTQVDAQTSDPLLSQCPSKGQLGAVSPKY